MYKDVRRAEMIYDRKSPISLEESLWISTCNAAWSLQRVRRQEVRIADEMLKEKQGKLKKRKRTKRRMKCNYCGGVFVSCQWDDGKWPSYCSIECTYDAVVKSRSKKIEVKSYGV